jgi:hypothetical protein
MAKRGRKGTTAATVDSGKLGDFAEVLGTVLGTAEHKARGWLDQRKQLATQLKQVRDKADQLLRELTGSATSIAGAATQLRRGRPVGSKTRKKRTLSAAARKAISDAQKARWARQKGAKG